jgi:enterochelin esterase-like enzyme
VASSAGGYDAATPTALVVFQDGWWYLDPDGEVRGGIVLDNLVHAGDLPVTVEVFVEPDVFEGVDDPDVRKKRNAEYDAFDDRYVSFLLDEVLPQVRQLWSISDAPDDWSICGGSSGGSGNGAFTAAWLRSDRFRKVLGCLTSFVQMPGGNPYPKLIPATPPETAADIHAGRAPRPQLGRARVELVGEQPPGGRGAG